MQTTDPELLQTQIQTQILAPQLRQSLKILQVPTLELRSTILEELQTNPALEELPMLGISLEEETPKETSPFDQTVNEENNEVNFDKEYATLAKLDRDWNEYFAEQSSNYSFSREDGLRHQHLLDSVASEASLEDFLMEQVKFTDYSEPVRAVLPYLLGSLDNNGFLTATIEEIAEANAADVEVVREAVAALKKLEPIGIGAQNLQECLLMQLDHKGLRDSIAYKILRDHYTLLLRRRVPELAHALSISMNAIQDAIEDISHLDPAPARRFGAINNQVIVADMTIYKDNDRWVVRSNSEFIPRLRISRSYKELMAQEKISESERDYIRNKIRSGKFLINAIHQRQETLQNIAHALLDFQYDFFEHGTAKLKPLTMSSVADLIGVHETTVSRAIANKYVETPHGTFELRYFFTSGFIDIDKGKSLSNRSVKEKVELLIETEDRKKPISDQAISDALAAENIHVARRTVAKYREELNILPTHLRRRF
ncbi:MAG: RNA polymerase sigma-54 factor [Verrucomicrobia bacterium GWF2_51_19]|nr:MAG: RNA polymerase sigma-54 factor [Verrucomicrobia bacterium GWF2_51_19]